MKLSSGVDIMEIQRIKDAIERHGERFLNRVYTPQEQAEVGRNPASLAVRFAAKEAASKALGTGIGPVGWLEIEVRGDDFHRPHLVLHGAAAQQAENLGLTEWTVSLSHSKTEAIAIVVAVGE